MRIVADRNISLVEDAFAELGEVVAVPSAAIDRARVAEADLLLVRSTVRVDEALLAGSRVRFVATATIGTDHLDVKYLEQSGIAWASAPGSNAPSVAEWWTAALLAAAQQKSRDPFGLRYGIVGVGNVGSRVEKVARAFGEVRLCDPPRARREAGDFVALDDLLPEVDVLTLHVPLERTGPDRTIDLIDARRLARLPRGAWVINAARGDVLDGDALLLALESGAVGAALLDVWAREPTPDRRLVTAATIATPHIAGHSLDGKVAGTRMIYQAACRFLQRAPTWRPMLPPRAPIEVDGGLGAVFDAHYPIVADDRALRAAALLSDEEYGRAFSRYRQSYPERRELAGRDVRCGSTAPASNVLAALGARPWPRR